MDLHAKTFEKFSHPHLGGGVDMRGEKNTLRVVILTLVTMFVEVAAGWWSGSMALLADGWHMGTHALALGISYAAYRLARAFGNNPVFSFGTGKFGVLAGYTNALLLGLAGAWIIWESAVRVFSPVPIAYTEAIVVAVLGLLVNAVSLLILNDGHGHEHEHAHVEACEDGHGHAQEKRGEDHNYKAAYLHVLTDALTSVMALAALFSGKFLGWAFMDPVIGLLGGALIARWSYGLLKATAATLLDAGQRDLVHKAVEIAQSDGDTRVADAHVWSIGPGSSAMVLSVISGQGRAAREYRERFENFPGLAHVNVEVFSCADPACVCRKD